MAHRDHLKFAVLVSANAEWAALKPLFPGLAIERSPYGEYFFQHIGDERVLFFHGGLGKVAAAASTQYAIDDFRPANLINIGTCGGVDEEYNGVYDQRTICGDWTLILDSGGFWIWPAPSHRAEVKPAKYIHLEEPLELVPA